MENPGDLSGAAMIAGRGGNDKVSGHLARRYTADDLDSSSGKGVHDAYPFIHEDKSPSHSTGLCYPLHWFLPALPDFSAGSSLVTDLAGRFEILSLFIAKTI